MGRTLKQLMGPALCALVGIATFGTAAQASAESGELQARPRGTYVRVDLPERSLTQTPREVNGGAPQIVFLNRCVGGLTLNPGLEDNSIGNVSSIITSSISFPQYPFGDAEWNAIVDGVREIFSPFNIMVTDVDPGNVPHDEAVVCGNSNVSPDFLDAAGIAPFACGVIPNAITYTFPETIGNDRRYTIETIAQEVAHGWGLDHSFKCEDPMTYLLECGDKSFQDGDFPCGEYEARACDCGGPTQNTHRYISELFGTGVADTQAPVATIVSPSDGETFDVGQTVTVSINATDDVGLSRVDLFADGMQAASDSEAPYGEWDLSNVPPGEHDLYIAAYDFSGNETLSEAITIYVGDDGPLPDGNGNGDDDDDDGGNGSDGDEDDDDGDEDDEDAEDADSDGLGGGGIPVAPYPTQSRGDEGCGCTMSDESKPGALLFTGLLVLGLVRRRRAV